MSVQLNDLPSEISLSILSYVEPPDLKCFAQTSKRNFDLATDDAVWRPHYREALADTFGFIPEVREALAPPGTPCVKRNGELRHGYKALQRIDAPAIRAQIDASATRGARVIGMLANPGVPLVGQGVMEVFLSNGSWRDFGLYRPLKKGLPHWTSSLLCVEATTLRMLGRRQQPWGNWSIYAERLLLAAYLGLAAYEAREEVVHNGNPRPWEDLNLKHVALSAACIGVVETYFSERSVARACAGAVQRSVDYLSTRATGSAWTSSGRRAQQHAQEISRALPEWVVQDVLQG